jgi:hypothetical protein
MSALQESSAEYYKEGMSYSPSAITTRSSVIAEPSKRSLRLVYSADWGIDFMSESPSIRIDPEVEREFKALSQEWRNRTAHLSLVNEQANDFAYHQIMAMGEKVLPLIFRELEAKASSGWIWALNAITRGKGPDIRHEDKGNVRSIVAAWLEWGKENGYVRR